MSLIKIPEAVGLQFTLLLKNMLSISVHASLTEGCQRGMTYNNYVFIISLKELIFYLDFLCFRPYLERYLW